MGPSASKMVVPEEHRIDIKRNNSSLNFKSNAFVADQQIIIEILKNHPFKMLLSRSALVPEEYLQQWWFFAELDENEEEFCSYVAGYRFAVKISDIRSIFALPSESAVVGKTSFDPIPTNSELISDFLKLGYNEDLTTLSSFRRKCLPSVWYTLFSFINTCLSGKHSSLDQASTNIRIIFHGIAHNRHYDYAKLIFEEMRTAIVKKTTFSYIPFQRYFQIFIKAAMRTVQGIPSLSNATHVQKFSLDSLRPPSSTKVFTSSSPLPKELLAYVNARNEVLVSYLESLTLQEPAESTPDSPLSGEVRVRVTRERGDVARVGEQHHSDVSPLKEKKKEKKVRQVRKRTKEMRTQGKEITTCAPTESIRATTKSDAPQSLEDIIEIAAPKAQLANPHVHSSASQQADVSLTHLEQHTHLPIGPHLEEPIVEQEGYMSPLHSVEHLIESIEPRSPDDHFIDTSTSPRDLPKQSVRHFVPTSIGDPVMDTRGLDGSPGEVNIKKASLKESFVGSDAVASTGQAAQDAVLKTVPSVGTGTVTYSSEFQQFKDYCSNEFEKIHRNIYELTKNSKSDEEGRVAVVLEKLHSEVIKKSELHTFQSEITKSFSEVASAVSSLKVDLSFSEENLATKSDVKIILDQLKQVQNYQQGLDERLKVLEAGTSTVSLKRKQVEQEEDDAQLEGENKRRKFSEDELIGTEPEPSEDVLLVTKSGSTEVMETVDDKFSDDERMDIDEAGYETDKISIDFENTDFEVDESIFSEELISEYLSDVGLSEDVVMSKDDVPSEDVAISEDVIISEVVIPSEDAVISEDVGVSEVSPNSNEDMLFEYLAQEEKFGEPSDLSDVIVFEEEENVCKEIVIWNPNAITSEVAVCEGFQKLFSNAIQRNDVMIPILKKNCFDERLEIFRRFFSQPAEETETFIHMEHLPDIEFVDIDYWCEFNEDISVMYRKPIPIPRLEFKVLEIPVIDKIFYRDMVDGEEDIVFPEDINSFLFRESLKDVTLESFISDKWSSELRSKVKDCLARHGRYDVQNSMLLRRILKVADECKDDLQLKVIGAERRNGSLVEFLEYEIYFLRLQDKLTLLNFCVAKEEIDLGKEIKRILGIYIRNITLHDFQLALENKVDKVNLLEPLVINFDSLMKGIFIVPELGFTYNVHNRDYKTFIISDIPKYSDSTLNWFLKYLDGHNLGAKNYCDEIIFLIKERIMFREFIRRVKSIAYSEVNLIREADYLLSCPYDFEVHGRSQFIQFEKPEVKSTDKGKRKLSEVASSEAHEKEIIVEEVEVSVKGKEVVEEKEASERVISEAEINLQSRVQEHALTLFLEFFHPEMFFDHSQRFDFIDCFLKKSVGWKLWYSRMIQGLKQNVQKVRKSSPIKKLISADLKSKQHFQYSSFKVERENGDICVFSEADFQNLYIRDLITVYHKMNPFHDKIAKFRKTFPTLREGIYREFIWAAKTDFFIAFILGKEKVMLKRPNFYLDGIERISRGTLILNPPGFVCKCQDERLFVRLEELHKVCNGTLMAIHERLIKRLRRKPKEIRSEEWSEYQAVAKNFAEKIEGLMEYRRIILGEVLPILAEWNFDLSF